MSCLLLRPSEWIYILSLDYIKIKDLARIPETIKLMNCINVQSNWLKSLEALKINKTKQMYCGYCTHFEDNKYCLIHVVSTGRSPRLIIVSLLRLM